MIAVISVSVAAGPHGSPMGTICRENEIKHNERRSSLRARKGMHGSDQLAHMRADAAADRVEQSRDGCTPGLPCVKGPQYTSISLSFSLSLSLSLSVNLMPHTHTHTLTHTHTHKQAHRGWLHMLFELLGCEQRPVWQMSIASRLC
jgi:hypothetical protein